MGQLGVWILLLFWSGCATHSFVQFKKQIVSRTNEVIVTFYDSKYMNGQTIRKLTEYRVDNQQEVGRFRKFIRRLKLRQEDCRRDGRMTFVGKDGVVQQMSFNLDNRCVALDGDLAQDDSKTRRHRLSLRGASWLQSLKAPIGLGEEK
ncbi:MAG: hypothetical protein JXR76_06700 [Deltaproteobacteria bacterium]|nr:hypothetical protein [Deltaproteobacteria bacterium]